MASKKVVLITGASSGLGEAMAEYLSEKGHIVYGASRSIKPSNRFYTLIMDVTDEDSVKQAVAKIMEEHGKIDVLINNAGIASLGPVEFVSMKDVESVFNTNLFGTLNTTKAVIAGMRKQRSGLIINVGSVTAIDRMPIPYSGAYNASKAALERYTETLRCEVKKFNINSCFLQLGSIADTEIFTSSLTTHEEANDIYNWEWYKHIAGNYVRNGIAKEKVNQVVIKIITSRRVKRIYRLCKIPERLLIYLRGILPEKLTEKIIMIYLRLQ